MIETIEEEEETLQIGAISQTGEEDIELREITSAVKATLGETMTEMVQEIETTMGREKTMIDRISAGITMISIMEGKTDSLKRTTIKITGQKLTKKGMFHMRFLKSLCPDQDQTRANLIRSTSQCKLPSILQMCR